MQFAIYYSKGDMVIYLRKKCNFESEWSGWYKITPVALQYNFIKHKIAEKQI